MAFDTKEVALMCGRRYNGIIYTTDSVGVKFVNCDFYNNQEFDQVRIVNSKDVIFDRCRFERNSVLSEFSTFFETEGSTEVVVKNCFFNENIAPELEIENQVFCPSG